MIASSDNTSDGQRAQQRMRKPADPSERVSSAYLELRQVAARFRRQYPHQTLQTTDLLHESYIRLVKNGPQEYVNEAHFFGSVAHAMHAVLVDRARRRNTKKRGGNCVKVSLDKIDPASVPLPRFEELHEALDKLNAFAPKLREVLELRFFFGFSHEEVAAAVGRAKSTVRKDCALARVWLQRELMKS